MSGATITQTDRLTEAFHLSDEILSGIELSKASLTSIALKCTRLAKLADDSEAELLFRYEAGGYPNDNGVPPQAWKLAVRAGRKCHHKEKDGTSRETIYTESISELEASASFCRAAVQAAIDPPISIASANPTQYVLTPSGNALERARLQGELRIAERRLATCRRIMHTYASNAYYQLKFANLASDIFGNIRSRCDALIARELPESIRRLDSIEVNLNSDNSEDWSNAVHSCRRVLEDLADKVFPPTSSTRQKMINGASREIALGKQNYVNRLVCFVEDCSGSETFRRVVGSHVDYIGERIDSIFGSATKGSHATLTREEAQRYVLFTYLLINDILLLRSEGKS